MDTILRKRRALKGRVTRINTALESQGDLPISKSISRKYLQQLDQLWTELNEIHDDLVLQCQEEDFDGHQEEYDQLAARIEILQATIPAPSDDQQTTHSGTVTDALVNGSVNVRLPKLELPTFSGDLLEWTSFFDLFSASVLNNHQLTGAQRLQYLKASLRSEAASLLQSIPVTDNNFTNAWEILQKRYHNKRELVNSHLKRWCAIVPLSGEAPSSLRKIIDVTDETVRALRVLNVPVDSWDAILVYLVSDKMDPESRRQWELSLCSTEVATYDQLKIFMEQRARALMTCSSAKPKSVPRPTHHHIERKNIPTSTHHVNSYNQSCHICKGAHPVYKCPRLLEAVPDQRRNIVKTNSLCFNCLSSGHQRNQCKSGCCKKCGNKHHTLLHVDQPEPRTSTNTSDSVVIHHSHQSPTNQESYQVLLATALIEIQDVNGSSQTFRALLDSGSQATFVTEGCVQRLGLKRKKSSTVVSGICSAPVNVSKGITSLKLRSHINSHFELNVDAHILKKVTGLLPSYECDPTSWAHIQTLRLADPVFNVPNTIDILLGAEVLALVLREGLRRGPSNTPIAQESEFGWLIQGKCNARGHVSKLSCNFISLDTAVQRFWELDSVPHSKPQSSEEKKCEEHFSRTHRRDSTGRFVVKLPFRGSEVVLEPKDTRDIAIRRLKQTERRIEKQPNISRDYHDFLTEYEALGHMKQVTPSDVKPVTSIYLPHHAVIREGHATTQLRVVFDASAKCKTGMSLNDHLMVGPTLQDDLFTILVRFRTHLIALTADITKMYRQIRIDEADTKYQAIVWRQSAKDPISDYRLQTVTYGTSSASYLATKCLQQLAKDEAHDFPDAAAITTRDFYMDDLLSGASTVEEAIQRRQDTSQLLARGGFELRKWASNSSTVLETVPPQLRQSRAPLRIDETDASKTLGLLWQPDIDKFSFCLTSQPPTLCNSKRSVLSSLARVFDPLGWLSPVTVKAKIIFQQLWRKSCSWDEPLPDEINLQWLNYIGDLSALESIKVDRCLFTKVTTKNQLHGFCDASERAYAAAIYLRSQHSNGEVEVTLIAAKTKVSPIKPVSLPRLELCGAVLLAKLLDSVQAALPIPIQSTYAWTDSTITLAWIKACPSRWKTFVANRAVEIQEKIPASQWFHIQSAENPADCASRGIGSSELQGHPLWWHGPKWLQTSSFPRMFQEDVSINEQAKVEEKTVLTGLVSVPHPMFCKYSSVTTLTRVTAHMFRFVNNCRTAANERLTGPLTFQETFLALLIWIKIAQSEQFPNEIKCLKDSKPLPSDSHLLCLHPFIDALGVLRVGGRIREAAIAVDRKFPILLPRNHMLTTLIVREEHIRSLHAGPQLLLATLQQRYWIINGRNITRQCVHKCVTCCRQRAKTQRPPMANLPAARVTPARPFSSSGVDYAGPLTMRALKLRGKTTYKAYIAIFVCFVTHAIHLELVSDLSTDAFLAAFRRFVARRGNCAHLYSDCGTNFVGANRELQSLQRLIRTQAHNKKVASSLCKVGTTWHFNPPAAPHFGGLWEAGVRSVKHHLRRVVGHTTLNFEEMYTLLTQIEACLNSRPLCPLSSDPNDYTALTPGHFLIGDTLTAIADPDYTCLKVSRLSRWQLIQTMLQHFWKRWRQEYLSNCQQRPKSSIKTSTLEVGDLVLVKDDNQSPSNWLLGRIIETHPGADGIVRVVTVKTATGQLRRPSVKICKLPNDST